MNGGPDYILGRLHQLDASGVDISTSEFEVYLSLGTTVVSMFKTIYTMQKVFKTQWYISYLSTWLILRIGLT